jgi:hypothetical protein
MVDTHVHLGYYIKDWTDLKSMSHHVQIIFLTIVLEANLKRDKNDIKNVQQIQKYLPKYYFITLSLQKRYFLKTTVQNVVWFLLQKLSKTPKMIKKLFKPLLKIFQLLSHSTRADKFFALCFFLIIISRLILNYIELSESKLIFFEFKITSAKWIQK